MFYNAKGEESLSSLLKDSQWMVPKRFNMHFPPCNIDFKEGFMYFGGTMLTHMQLFSEFCFAISLIFKLQTLSMNEIKSS